jgi:hypothetical protein
MWLSPPVDDRQSTHLRKLKKTACFAFISLFYVAMWRVCFRSAVFLCGILCWTKLDVWETTELFLHLWGLSISAVKSSLREMFQMHLSATESLENRHENNCVCDRLCCSSLKTPSTLPLLWGSKSRYWEDQNRRQQFHAEKVRGAGGLQPCERSSTGMLTFIMKIVRWRTFFLSEVHLTILVCVFCLFLDSWQKECSPWKLSTTTQTLIYKSWYICSREAHRTRSTNPHDEWQISLCPLFPCLV